MFGFSSLNVPMQRRKANEQTKHKHIRTKKNVVDETKAKRSAENSQGNVYIKSGKINQM